MEFEWFDGFCNGVLVFLCAKVCCEISQQGKAFILD